MSEITLPQTTQEKASNLKLDLDDKNILVLMYIATGFFSIFPATVVYILRSQHKDLAKAAKKLINFELSFMLYGFLLGSLMALLLVIVRVQLLSIVPIVFIVFTLGSLARIALLVMAIFAVRSDEDFTFPGAIKILE